MVYHSTIGSIGKGERASGVGVIETPSLATNATSSKIIHSWLYTLVAQVVVATKGIDLVGSQFAEIGYELCHLINTPPKLITKSKHTKRGMMTIPTKNIFALLVQECHEQRILIVEATPEREFRLQDDTQFVGSCKGGIRGTPRVETHVIDAIVGTPTQIILPRVHIHSHMPSHRPYTGIVLASQEKLMPIGIEVLSFDMKIAEVGVNRFYCD